MLIEKMHIEFTNILTNEIEKQDVQHCFHLATLSEPMGIKERQGLCIGLQLPHKSIKESQDFWNKLHGPYVVGMKTPIAYFCTDNCRVPFYTFDGNLYDETYGSSCLFGYVSPFLFSSTDRPKVMEGKKKEFGSYLMELDKSTER